MESPIRLLIVGGCFPLQNNILTENLYHQLLKKEIESEFLRDVDIKIVHYEKFYPTLDKIRKAIEHQFPDLIIFHIRTEQILRMIKFYFKYHDTNENFNRGFNVALFGKIIPEKEYFNLYHTSIKVNNNVQKRSNSFLVEINYLLGYLLLNQYSAFRIYKGLISQIVNLTNQKSINVIFTGPVSRPTTFLENHTSIILNSYMKKIISRKFNNTYLDLLGVFDNKQFLFCEDNIRVNELGHKRIAKILFDSIKNLQTF